MLVAVLEAVCVPLLSVELAVGWPVVGLCLLAVFECSIGQTAIAGELRASELKVSELNATKLRTTKLRAAECS